MTRNKIVETLLEAAAELEDIEETTIMPGWDDTAEYQSRYESIRDTARAIAAEELTSDEGTKVQVSKLGMLVRYIAEMLEE